MNEEEILELIIDKANYEKAFNKIFKAYSKKIYWNVRRILISHQDADDATQNIFIKIWNALPKFKGESKLSTWIYRITINESLTFLKNKKLKTSLLFSDYETELANLIVSDTGFDGNEIEKKLNLAILQLPPKQRQVFNLRYYDEMPYQEMEKILDTSAGALKASYHIAVEKIEKFLNQN